MNNFERIVEYLRYEGIPKTPQEISDYTSINLDEVYEILKGNKIFFIEIINENSLLGWKVYSGYF